eukprot:1392788-Amorphochlora_amoeboformis.AAC.2
MYVWVFIPGQTSVRGLEIFGGGGGICSVCDVDVDVDADADVDVDIDSEFESDFASGFPAWFAG